MKRLAVILFVLLMAGQAFSQNGDFDSRVKNGIRQIYNIKFDEADRTFKEVIADYPKHPAGKFFLAMIDWWKILLDLDNESYDDIFFAKLEDVIFQCDQILDKDPSNVDALFFKGGSIGFRGRLRAMRESWIKAADDGREALPIVNHAYKLNPNNVDVQLGFGIYDYYAAVIPAKYPMIKPLMMFFPSGDKEKGIKELTNVAMNGKYAKTESRYFLMQLYYQFEENFQKAEEFAKMLTSEYPDNPLFERYQGRINIRKGSLFTADSIFSDVYRKYQQKFPGYNEQSRREATYYLGYYRRNMGQTDAAIQYFQECENASRKLDKDEASGFMVNTLLYLGNLYDQKGERDRAVKYYKEVLDVKEFGHSHNLAGQYLQKPYQR
ncbi:MAG: tetratricopeptide repeat protein [Bacteroidota bacterium]|nr:tetratricopeptide repeat protein [Ignavibacteria bacterium]MCU7512495.1 tetratricopeptide repeat protein [Ignavibacteria bacterium]MCU7520908.1 tetratricopeptide repeat protein [Ignavibacteria bacterium]MCU7523586.1 tetratricopeptide repeat protein [Ignavibacteria bacterium]